jgi:rare lipoprotein A
MPATARTPLCRPYGGAQVCDAVRRAAALGLVLALAAALFGGCATPGPVERANARGLESYRVNGVKYVPLREWHGFREEGMASWYGGRFHGRKTASGERFDAFASLTAAHKTLPFNVCAEVEHLRTGRSVVVRINDRGPFARGRVIDLSHAAASEIGLVRSGLARVRVEAVGVADADGRCRTA